MYIVGVTSENTVDAKVPGGFGTKVPDLHDTKAPDVLFETFH